MKVPGATLFFEERGAGPLLVLIPGGPTDADVFSSVARALADRYHVVAIDPRGNSRSVFDAAPVAQDLIVHASDVAALIGHLGEGPAFVFGNSGGAQIGLALAADHSVHVRALIAHEPPCVRLLPDGDAVLAAMAAARETFHAEGIDAGLRAFMSTAGIEVPATAPGSGSAHPMFKRIRANLIYFMGQGMLELAGYTPDLAQLARVRVAVGIGGETAGQLAHRTAIALAAALGVAPVAFPGDHTGFITHPAGFAAVIARTFGSNDSAA